MKFLIALSLLVGANAFAADKGKPAQQSKDVCERFMTCGTYVHPRDAQKEDSVETKIVIQSAGDMKATFDYVLTDKDGNSDRWPLEATFQEDGSAVMIWKGGSAHNGKVYAVALCALKMCNYALVPFETEQNGIWGNAGLMRFTDTGLEFMMTVGIPTAYRSNGFTLEKR